MRILFLSRWYPFPADNGSKIRIYNLVKQLARTHDVWLLSFAEEAVAGERIEAMRDMCRHVETMPYVRHLPGSAQAALGWFSPRPSSAVQSFSQAMQMRIEQLSAQTKFDVVVASQIDMAPYGVFARGVPKVLEEVEISIYREQARRAKGALARARKQLMWAKWQAYFRGLLKQYDGCTVVSEPEVAPIRMSQQGYEPIAVIPNGADIERFTGDFGRPQPSQIIYTGALTYYVNFDAMKFFIGEVFPRVQTDCPNAKLRMAGKLDGVLVHDLPQNSAATHAGHQEDIRPFVANGWVSVVPERVGGGTRIKVLESMALGTPVVATKWGAAGLTVTPGHDILASDDPIELAGHLVRVLSDPTLRQMLSVNGRRTIEERYDWRVIGSQFNDFLESVTRRI